VALSRRSGRSRFTIILLVLTSITFLTLDFRGFGPLDSARSAVLSAFAPVGDFAAGIFRPIGDGWNNAFHGDDLQAENDRLRQQVDELQGQLTQGDVAKQSLQQLLEQADLQFVGNIPTTKAQVVSGAVSNFDQTIEIDKGTSSGIKKGMPVVTGRGLIGRVARVADNRSVVEMVTDGNFTVGFSVVGTNALGVAKGQGDASTMRGSVDVEREVLPGQILVTSGVAGSYFPQGLPIGTVSGVTNAEGSLQKDLDITLLADMHDLTYVTVVLWEPQS